MQKESMGLICFLKEGDHLWSSDRWWRCEVEEVYTGVETSGVGLSGQLACAAIRMDSDAGVQRQR